MSIKNNNSEKVLYIAGANVPSQAPNTIQTINMAYAFSKIQKNFGLVLNSGIFTNAQKIIVKDYDFKKLVCINIPCSISFDTYRPKNYKNSIYNKTASFYAYLKKPHLVYTRVPEIANRCVSIGLKTVLEYHNPFDQKIDYRSDNFVGLVTISEDLANGFMKNGIDQNKIIVEQDGVWSKRFNVKKEKKELRNKYRLPEDKKIYTYCGNLHAYKGIPLILDVANHFRKDVFLLVGGWPEDVRRVQKEINEKKIENVICLGNVKQKNIPEVLYLSDILLLVNSGKHFMSDTTSPLKLFEYMASGVPVVASKLRNIERVLRDGENAILFTPDSVPDLSHKIKMVSDNKDLSIKIARKAKVDVLYYDWEKRAQRIMDRINELI